MLELLSYLDMLVWLYIYIIFASVVMSWLLAFDVVNRRNQFVYSLGRFINALTEPALRRIRPWMPDLGGIDISPMVLVLICLFVLRVVIPNLAKLVA